MPGGERYQRASLVSRIDEIRQTGKLAFAQKAKVVRLQPPYGLDCRKTVWHILMRPRLWALECRLNGSCGGSPAAPPAGNRFAAELLPGARSHILNGAPDGPAAVYPEEFWLTDFEHHYCDTRDVRLHYVTLGAGDPLVLLHGWPQTWFAWRHVMPLLAQQYRVIAPDLRGLGDSSRPLTGYDKRTMGRDIWRLVHDHLGIGRFNLVGHDWGGPVAYAIAAEHPDAIRRLAIPGDGSPNISQGGRRWHHAFHQTADLPEALVQGREAIYLDWFYQNYGHRPGVLDQQDIAEYIRCYVQPGAMAAGFALYRALPRYIADNEETARSLKLPMPVLALGGADGWGRREEVLESVSRLASDVRGGVLEDCGHWMPEEQPEELSRRLMEFFR